MPLTEAPGQGRLVDIGDTRLFVVEKSLEGPPLICLHGGPGFDHWAFGEQLDPLATDLRLILVDLRGHGMSEPAPSESLTLSVMANDVVQVAEALELDEFAVLGHSFGGFVALRLAVDQPAAASALILVCTAAAVDHPPAPAGDEPSVEELRRAFEASQPLLFADENDPRIGAWQRATAPIVFRPELTTAFRRTGVDHDLGDRLAEIGEPTLVIAGRHDRIVPLHESERLARDIPGARLVVLERSGHLPFVEEPDAFLDTVRPFVLER